MTIAPRGPRRALIVIPTYDEAATITTVLRRLRVAAPSADVLVVDDGSPDGTADLVDQHARLDPAVHLLRRPRKGGLGGAYRAGFAWALDHDHDAVVQIDADLSHPPELVPELLDALSSADVAVGSRYVAGGDVSGWSISRRVVSRAGNAYARRMLGIHVHDVTAGFKALRREAVLSCRVLDTTSDGYCFQIENAWNASRARMRVVEVPIAFVDRTHGASKMSGTIAFEAMWRVLAWRVASLGSPLASSRRTRSSRTRSRWPLGAPGSFGPRG